MIVTRATAFLPLLLLACGGAQSPNSTDPSRTEAVALVDAAPTTETAASRDVAVEPAHFDGEKGGAKNLSGMACAEPEGGTRVCLVVDDEGNFAQWATFDGERLSPGAHVALVPTPLGQDDVIVPGCDKGKAKNQEADGEAVAYLAPYWYVIGSSGCSRHKNKTNDPAFRIYRVRRGATSSEASSARVALAFRSLTGIKEYAERCVGQLDDDGDDLCKPGEVANGANVEGLTASGGTLHVGLRAPTTNGDAFIVDFDPAALFAAAAPTLSPTVRRVHLGAKLGIRDLAALPDGRLVVLSGPSQEEPTTYGLHMLPSNGSPQPLQGWRPKAGKAETVVVISADATTATLLVMYDGLPDGAPELVQVDLPPAGAAAATR